jgi:ankyrin repeat protein
VWPCGCGFFLGLTSGPQAKEGVAVSESLPERPDLDQLRRRAKELRDAARRGDPAAADRFARHHPKAGHGEVTLAAAQLVIARESGFASWPRLKAEVDADASTQRGVPDFLAACVDGHLGHAADMLRDDPGLARRDLRAATLLGDADVVRQMLGLDPAAAVGIDDERGWPPLLYACYSPWPRIDPDRAAGSAEVVRLLLDAGASPNTNDGGRLRYRSALKGSVETDNPGVTEVLLEAGALPDPGQPVVEAVGRRDHRCLRLLLAHGARVERTWALGAAAYHDDAVAMSLLLDALASAGLDAARRATESLPDAAANASPPVVAALLDAGADPNATDDEGMSALRLAVRAGKGETATRLLAGGATDDGTDVDRFLGACLNADRRAAEELLAARPDLRDDLREEDRAVIVDAAGSGSAEAVALMLDLGFSPHVRKFDEQALHTAAYWGNAPVVRVLLDAGADVDARDQRFEATPLAFATVGSGEQAGRAGDWTGAVTLLIEAGASREDVWVSSKPPSEEVMALLARYGIGPEESPRLEPDEQMEVPGSIGTGVMADIARHLDAAYRDVDLDLLGSLLHPEVRWTGACTNKAQVVDWYRGLMAEGTVAAVESVEVDRDAVILGLSVTLPAEGARPAPPQKVYQVFTVAEAEIVDIRGYPDRTSALSRT